MVPVGDAHVLHALLMELVRSAGLLQPGQDAPGTDLPLSMSEVFALHEIDVAGPLPQRDLAERLHLEKSTVSRLLAGLEGKELVIRERDPDNRRSYRLRLSEAGRVAHRDVASAFNQHYVGVLARMTTTERGALALGLTALLRALEDRGVSEPDRNAVNRNSRQAPTAGN